MEKKSVTVKEVRQRKLFLVLPVLALPFLTLFFWALGGGKVEAAPTTPGQDKGFNASLPNPNFKSDKPLDKLSYYDNASKDSLKLKATERRLPDDELQQMAFDGGDVHQGQEPEPRNAPRSRAYRNPSEAKVYQRLEALQQALNKAPAPPGPSRASRGAARTEMVQNPDVEKLEGMMKSMSEPAGADPELQQLGSMLETIVDIQHPERVQERLRAQSEQERGKVFSVLPITSDNTISVLQAHNQGYLNSPVSTGGFYTLDQENEAQTTNNAISAVIHESQILVNGSAVKLRLTSAIMVNGVLIPEGHFVFGTAALKGERLTVRITSLQYAASIFQVDLSVYDMDGMEGIYVPGAIARDVAKSSADRSMQSLGITSLDDSWSSQATGAGIEAAKTLFSKKVKLVKVTVKAGYQVLLYDEKVNRK
jgi:conjugative transposon TraM protein